MDTFSLLLPQFHRVKSAFSFPALSDLSVLRLQSRNSVEFISGWAQLYAVWLTTVTKLSCDSVFAPQLTKATHTYLHPRYQTFYELYPLYHLIVNQTAWTQIWWWASHLNSLNKSLIQPSKMDDLFKWYIKSNIITSFHKYFQFINKLNIFFLFY